MRALMRVTMRVRALLVVTSLCAVAGLLVVAPAMAGTTGASSFTKTGTDATNGSTAAATSAVGRTAAGDTINWVLHYRNTTGSPANADLTDPIGANQAFVPGSLRIPTGFSPAWSTNGGGSYTSTEPAAGVNAIRAAGPSVDGSTGVQSLFSPPLASFNAGASRGDGWETLFVGPNIWNIHHHTVQQNSGGATIIDCHVAATGAECPGYPATGQTVPTTSGTPLGTAVPAGDTVVTAFHNNAAVYNGRIYFASALGGSTSIGVSCVDTTTNTSCGYTQLGTSSFATPTVPTSSAEVSGGAQIGSRYYVLGAAPGAPVLCFDMAANAPCAGWSNPSSIPGLTPARYGVASFSALDSWGGYIFTSSTPFAVAGNTDALGCIVAATGALCPGFPKTEPPTGSSSTLAPITDASGTVTGVCRGNEPSVNVATYVCYDIATGALIPGGAPFASVIPSGDSAGFNVTADPLLLGTRLYQPWVNSTGAGQSTYTCWDYATNSACAGFTPVSSGANVRAYTIRQDPNAPDCLWELGDAGVFETFSATFGGSASCNEGAAQVKLTPSQAYCDGQSGHVTGWKQLQLYGVNPSQYDAVAVTIADANGNPVPGWTNKIVPSGQVPIDISSIPYSGSTTTLNVQVAIDWGQHPAVQGAAVAATYTGDPVEVCFQTKVGDAQCTADQGITNNGNAITVGADNVTDTPDGDNTGAAMFVEAVDGTTAGCQADLSIAKQADGTSVRAGGQLMYTLVVRDHGPVTATNVIASDAIPAGLSVVSVTPSQGSCTAAGAINCSLGTILDGGSAQILVVANVASAASGSITNCATTSGFQTDPNTANNSDCRAVSISSPPSSPQSVDVQVVKRVNHPVAKAGEVLTYTLNIKNNGPATAPNVGVTDTSAIGMRVRSIKPSQGTCTKGVPFTCTLGALAAGKRATVTIRAIPRQAGSEINSVSTTPGCSDGSCPPDSHTSNNVSHAKTRVRPALQLVKTVNHHVVRGGAKLTYHLKVTNPTAVALKHVRVCDRLPAGLVYVSANPKAKLAKGRECWRLKKLGAHRSRTIALHARVLKRTSGRKINHATATAKGVATAKAKATVRVIRALRLVKTVNHKVVRAGQKLTYHLKVTNPNSVALRNVRVCDRLPLGLVYVGAHPKAKLANGGQCWSYKSLGAHKSRTIRLYARALKGTRGHKTNHATATANGVPTAKARATVRVKPAPRPPATPVTG